MQRQEEEDLPLPEAIRAAAIAQPNLHAAWLEEVNKKRELEEQGKREKAARIRSRND